ncbi:MAG: hypothetical protein R2707_08080 [Acidimicrobiales bacterium]
MTDPPDRDGEVPERFLELIDEILASEAFQAPPSSIAARRAVSRPPRRLAVYAVAAAAVVALAIVGASALNDSDISSVDTERAANPISSATPIPGVADDGGAAQRAAESQIAADAEIAASFGLTLGPRVFRDDGSFVLADQPDLMPVFDDEQLVGYARRGDIDLGDETTRFTVYAPDGVTVLGVFDQRTGFVPSTAPSASQGD